MGLHCLKKGNVKGNIPTPIIAVIVLYLYVFSRGRENANGKDLNRDFPEQFPKKTEDFREGRQLETLAIMDWILENPFVLSANFHGGAMLASYPYDSSESHKDGVYSTAPDDKMFKLLATTYSNNHRKMHKNVKCSPWEDFPGGIVNGAQWYDVIGGMQVLLCNSPDLSMLSEFRISTISTQTAWR